MGDKSDEWARRAKTATARINRDIRGVRQEASRGADFEMRADAGELSGIERTMSRIRVSAKRGADMEVRGDARGLSGIFNAISRVRRDAERGAEMSVRGDARGLSEIHGAVQRLRAMVSRGADFEVRGKGPGLSALHSAISRIRANASRAVDFEVRGDGKGLSTLSATMSRIRGDASRGAEFEVRESGSAGVVSALIAVNKARGTVDGSDARLSTSVSGAASTTAELMGVDAAASKVDGRSVRLDVDRSSIGVLDSIGQSMSETAQRIRNFGTIIPTVAFPVLLAGLGAIPPLATAAGAAVGGLASAVGQGLAGAAGIGGSALSGMTAGLGLVLAAAQPTISAFSNMEQATGEVASAEKTASSAADALAQAHRSLADASRGVKDAQKSAAQGVADATAQYQDALRGVEDAQEGVADAERGVADARREANKGVVDAQNKYRDAVSGVEDAERKLADATRSVGDARRESSQGVADAEAKYRDAVRGVEDAQRDAAEAAQGVADARREAVRGVAEAESKYRDSLRDVAEAERKVAEANQGVSDARREAYEGVQDAVRSYQDSLRDVRSAEEGLRSARADLYQASEELTFAQRDLNQAMQDEPRNQAYATLDLAEARDRASDATREYNKAVREYGRNSEEATDAARQMQRAELDLAAQQDETNKIRKYGSDELRAASEGVKTSYEAQQAAQQRVRDSEEALQDARRKASREQAGIEAARQEGARKVADAQAEVASAQRDLTEAVRKSNEAQAGIEAARVEGARKVADAQKQVADAQRGVEDAQRKAASAAQDIEQARIEGARKVADAQRDVADAQRGVQEANRKAAEAAAGIEAARVEGARKVADAQRAVGDAQEQVADAVRAANEAQAGIEQARIDGAKQVADAQRQVLDAQRALAKATRENASAQTALGKAASAVGAKLTKSQAVLLAAAKRFGATFSRVIRPANDAFNRLGARILGVGEGALPSLGRTALRTVNEVSGAFDTLLAQWTMPRQLTLFNEALQAIPRFTRLGVQAAGQLATGVGNIFIAAIPQADRFLVSLDNVTRRFNAWTRSVEGQRSLGQFFARAAHYGKVLGGTILDLTLGLVGLGGAFDEAGVTGQVLTGLRNTARRFREITSASGESRASVVSYARDTRPTLAAMGDLLGSVTNEWFRVSGAILRARNESGKLIMPQALKDMRPALRAIGDLLISSFKNFGPLIAPAITQLARFMEIFIAKNPVIKTFAHLLIGALRVFNNLPGPIQSVIVSLVSMRIAMNALGIGKWLIAPLTVLRGKMAATGAGMTAMAAKTNTAAAANTRLSTSASMAGGTMLVTGKKAQAAKAGTAAAGGAAAKGAGRFAGLAAKARVAGLALVALAGGPVGAAVAGIALVGVGLVAAYRRSETFRGAMKGLGRKFIDNKGLSALWSQSLAGLRKRIKEAGGAGKIARGFFAQLGKKMSDNKGLSALWAGKLQGLGKKMRANNQTTKVATNSTADLGVKIRSLNKRLEAQGGGIKAIRKQWQKPPIYKRQDWGGKIIGLWNEMSRKSDKVTSTIARHYKNRSNEASSRWMGRFSKLKNNEYFPWLASVNARVKRWGGNIADIYKNRSNDAGDRWMRRMNKLKSGQYSPWLTSVWSRVGRWGGNIAEIYQNRSDDASNRWMKRFNRLKSGQYFPWLGSVWSRTKSWGGNIVDIYRNRSDDAANRWMQRMRSLKSSFAKWRKDVWGGVKSWAGNVADEMVKRWPKTVNTVRKWLGGLATAMSKVLSAIGMDKAAGKLSDRAAKLNAPLKFARGGEVNKYARGGVETGNGQITTGITGIAGEAGRESIVPHTRWTPEGQKAYDAVPDTYRERSHRRAGGHDKRAVPPVAERGVSSPPPRGSHSHVHDQLPERQLKKKSKGTRGAHPVFARTHHNVYDYIKNRADDIMKGVSGISWNTYHHHITAPGANEHSSIDLWGPGGSGDAIGGSKGQQAANYVVNNHAAGNLGTIWNRQVSTGGGWSGFGGGPHLDHVHIGWSTDPNAKIVKGSGGGGFFSGVRDALGNAYNSVSDFMSKKFKPPEIPSLGMGEFGTALTGGLSKKVLGGARKYLTDLAKEKLSFGSGGGSSGPAPEGKVKDWIKSGFKMGQAFPASESNVGAMYGRVMQESGGDPRAVNRWDSNWFRGTPSKGLVQIIEPTWNAHTRPDIGQFDQNWSDPVKSVAVSSRYMKSQYGRVVGSNGRGYRRGGVVPGPKGMPYQGTLHGGERVLPEEYVGSWDNAARALDAFGKHPEVNSVALDGRAASNGVEGRLERIEQVLERQEKKMMTEEGLSRAQIQAVKRAISSGATDPELDHILSEALS